MRPIHRLPAYALNGLAVASGIGVAQLLIGALLGEHAAQWALSGAACASLANVPNTAPAPGTGCRRRRLASPRR